MRFVNFLAAVIGITSVAAAPLMKRDATTVEGDIAKILSDLTSLDSEVNSFSGGFAGGLAFLGAYNTLKSAIEGATSDVNSAGQLSPTDSATIVGNLTAVVAEVQQVTTDLIAKASTVSSSGFTSYVLGALKTLLSDSNAFFTALNGTVDASLSSNVTSDATACANALNSAIAVY